MKIAIVSNPKIKNVEPVISEITESLSNAGLESDILKLDNLQDCYDFVLAIGGDGTILKSSRFYSKRAIPVMGINLGRLGFLSLITKEEISNLGDIIKNKKYIIEERTMLKSGKYTALNDFVVKGHSNIRTSKFNMYINDKLISEYIADGIIISTPTGSTAYGLSAGGPIIHPGLESMVIVPICAHTMTARPLVVPVTEKVRIKSVDESLDLSSDGQEKITEVKEVTIEQCEHKAKLAFPPSDDNFYSVLQSKLLWGISPVSEG